MIKVLMMDADGVLLNAERRFSHNLEMDHGITRELTREFFEGVFRKATIGKADLKEIIKPYLKKWGWKGSVDELLDYWFKTEHSLDHQLIDYIQKLRKEGIKCVVATNQEKYRAKYLLKKMGFEKYFDHFYVSCELGCMKPDKKYYQCVIEDLGVDEKEVLFWDNAESHVKAAKDFGIPSELYTDFEDFKRKMQKWLLI